MTGPVRNEGHLNERARRPHLACLVKAGPFCFCAWAHSGGAFSIKLLAAALFALLGIFASYPVAAAEQASVDLADPAGAIGQLNTTGRAIQLPVPVKDGGTMLGEASLRIDADDQIRLSKGQLGDLLKDTLETDALARLASLNGNDVTLEELRAAGFNFEFDRGLLELNFLPDLNQRGETDLSLGGHVQRPKSAVAVEPANFSAYLNVLMGVDHVWDAGPSRYGDSETGLRFDLQGVMRAGGFVVENEVAYEGAVDSNDCPIEAYCVYQHEEGFKRQATRIVYDRPEDRIRVQLGDTNTFAAGMQNSPSLLGVAVEKSNRKLAPGINIRPTGSSSFQLVRPSQVEVLVNGSILRRFNLRPGSYNLRDLPLGVGANEVELVITDDTGHKESINFTQFFDHNLLAAGQSEWLAAGGVASSLVDNAREYQDEDYFGTGFLRYGLSNEMTGEAHLQADARVLMSGLGVFRATSWGAFGLESSVSSSDTGIGYAASASWAVSNFKGPVSMLTGLTDSFYLNTAYQSDDFRKPGEYLLADGDIIYPQYPYSLRATASYMTMLAPSVTATLAGRYQLAANDPLILSPFTFVGDRYGADVTLSTSFGVASASLTMGYSNEYFYADPSRSNPDDGGEFRISARVYLRPDNSTRISSTYDTLNDTLTVSANRDAGQGIERWATTVDVQRNGYDSNGAASASATYYGNRAEVQVLHRAGLNDFSWNELTSSPEDQRSSLRVGTALAFADGKFAIGAPIRGDAFAIVHPHESLEGKVVEVRSGDVVRAQADEFGPALVSQIPVYTNSTLPIDVEDLPIGYSLGSGAFDLRPSYQSGHVLEVGSENAVTVYGTLQTADGEAVGLVMGEAYRADDPERRVEFFTNKSGKFAAEGLSSGEWILEAATEYQPTMFVLQVPDGTEGLLKAGKLKPTGRT